jgi:hypothetical protein
MQLRKYDQTCVLPNMNSPRAASSLAPRLVVGAKGRATLQPRVKAQEALASHMVEVTMQAALHSQPAD